MKIIVAGNITDAVADSLKQQGFDIILSAPNKNLLDGLWYHPDMQIARVGSVAVCDPALYGYYNTFFQHLDIRLLSGKKQTKCNYPQDVAYNIKVAENSVFHNFKYTDEVLLDALYGKKLINVSQGYSGCSMCIVGGKAVITADNGIHSSALQNGLESLLISPGHIRLPGFDYGFIGGASFCYDGRLYFFGNAENHPDFARIYDFCRKHDTCIYSLTEGELFDYGSAVTLD